jgi:hypothetical protein
MFKRQKNLLERRSKTMIVKSLEVYAQGSNCAVVKPPGRKFPGCVIQGDSLRHLCGLAVSVAERVRDRTPQDEEFMGDLQELVHRLVGRLLHYQQVMQAHGIKLPYSRPLTEAHLVRLLPGVEDA